MESNDRRATGNVPSAIHSASGAAMPTVASVLGEITWLMSQSPAHRQMFISDLEWLIMPPLLLGQFRLFHAPVPGAGAVATWATEAPARSGAAEGAGKRPPTPATAAATAASEAVTPGATAPGIDADAYKPPRESAGKGSNGSHSPTSGETVAASQPRDAGRTAGEPASDHPIGTCSAAHGSSAPAGLTPAPQRPIGVVLWALVDAEVEARLAAGGARMRPQDWRSGDRLWVVEVIAPPQAGAPTGSLAEAMVADLKRVVFPERKIKMRRVVGGKAEVGEV